mgnify:CR=1 FL=1
MAAKKTSAEKAREDAENARVENMLDGAFGTLSGLEINKVEDVDSEDTVPNEELMEKIEDVTENLSDDAEEDAKFEDGTEPSTVEQDIPEDKSTPPDLPAPNAEKEELSEDMEKPPSGPPTKGPPSKPPTGPPTKGPPSKPPTGPPTKGPPSKPPSGPPTKSPPSGPPSKGPPSKPPMIPSSDNPLNEPPVESLPSEPPVDDSPGEMLPENADDKAGDASVEVLKEDTKQTDTDSSEDIAKDEPPADMPEETPEGSQDIEEEPEETDISSETEKLGTEEETEMADLTDSDDEDVEDSTILQEDVVSKNIETEAEIARLSAEVERLRKSMAGAAEVIEELENPPMPPAIMEDLVIGAHIVGDMARLARQLDREQLIRASMGTIAMLHPEQLEIIISTKHMSLLPRMDERDICAAKLGVDPPRGAPEDWRVLEVVLASVSLITGGPAAVIHSHGPFTTAASCEKDLVLVQPIDEIGKKHIGKIIIVDPDDENPEEFLRQVAEALQQGGMRCVVIRGKGAYAVGADLDQAWANAAMLEHSMKVVLLARQANLKV